MDQRQVMIVTGATNGIGEAAAMALAARGVQVGIVARNPRTADATVARVEAASPGAAVDVFIGDLALMSEVRKVATEILDGPRPRRGHGRGRGRGRVRPPA